jgi:hypothetical protein
MTSLLHLVPDPARPVPRPVSASPEFGDGEARRGAYVRTKAETAECTCPDFCERDHGND